jgi:hypothetical protein
LEESHQKQWRAEPVACIEHQDFALPAAHALFWHTQQKELAVGSFQKAELSNRRDCCQKWIKTLYGFGMNKIKDYECGL